MAIKFTNNASSKLTQALTTSATSMHIKAEDVSKFPVLGAGDYCLLTLVGDNSNHEIVKVTKISSDGTCTIERAQDSTTAKEWPADNRVELRITAEFLNNTADAKVVEELINTTIPSLPDNKTISLENEKLQVKDVAIGGDSSDLVSARGFFYDTYVPWWANDYNESYNVLDFNEYTIPGIYHIRWREGTPYTDSDDVEWPVTLNNPNAGRGSSYWFDGVLEVSQVSSASYTSSFKRLQHKVSVFAPTSYQNSIFIRTQKVTTGSPWGEWTSFITESKIGDGIKNTKGYLSVPEYEGATSSASATSGLVPPASSSERNNFLRGDGTWQQVDLSDYALKTELSKYLPLTGGKLSGGLEITTGTRPLTITNNTGSYADVIFYRNDGTSRLATFRAASDKGVNNFLVGVNGLDNSTPKGLVLKRSSSATTCEWPITIPSSASDSHITTIKWVNDKLADYLPITGTAAKATILATARTIRTNLASTSAASFNGSANITPGVTGVLPVANGGTGSNTEKYLKLEGGNLTGPVSFDYGSLITFNISTGNSKSLTFKEKTSNKKLSFIQGEATTDSTYLDFEIYDSAGKTSKGLNLRRTDSNYYCEWQPTIPSGASLKQVTTIGWVKDYLANSSNTASILEGCWVSINSNNTLPSYGSWNCIFVPLKSGLTAKVVERTAGGSELNASPNFVIMAIRVA